MQVKLNRDILEANDLLAQRNRQLLADRDILCLNLIGSPGSGKTTLLEGTVERMLAAGRLRPAVIEGDIATTRDAERMERKGAIALQINTEGGCHLDATMISAALADLPLDDINVLFIENVGNLVCPTGFDLGEFAKVVVYSIAEGDDKPAKYPGIFSRARLAVLNKMDLAPYIDFDADRAKAEMRGINPDIHILEVVARTGDGLDAWLEWIDAAAERARG